VITYIVSPITSGAASCPRSTPVENVQAMVRFFTLPAVICFNPLKRVPA